MDFNLSKQQELIRQLMHDFAENEVKPLAAEIDDTEQFPVETVRKMAKYGMLGINIPAQYGGAGGDTLSYIIAIEELAKVCATTSIILSAHTSLACYPILAYGTEEQKQKYLVPLAKGEKLGAFGKFLHDTCNFKYLMVEKILQALYIFTTAAVIIFGVLMLFRTEYNYWTGDRIWMGGYGLLIIILGPIAIRLSYELMMMAILLLKNVIPKHMECISAKLMEMGVSVTEDDDSLLVRRSGPLTKTNVKTLPYPGFPTDMQPQITAVLALAAGTSLVTEGVYGANRFKYVDELKRLGAHIQVDGKVAVVEGVKQLVGAPIQACDLRAGAALVIAGLAAQGTTELSHINYIERGYEDLVGKLRAVGADISLVDVPDEADTETHAG